MILLLKRSRIRRLLRRHQNLLLLKLFNRLCRKVGAATKRRWALSHSMVLHCSKLFRRDNTCALLMTAKNVECLAVLLLGRHQRHF